MFIKIGELFSEKKCYGCQKLGHFFCPQCYNNLEIYTPYCYLCKKSSHKFYTHKDCQKYFPLEQVVVLTRYRNKGIKKLLKHAKYYGKYQAYGDLAHGGKKFFQDNIVEQNSVFIPIPIPFFRRWKRGYNQTDIITAYLSKIVDIPIENTILKRKLYSVQQSHLSQTQRKKNLENAFYVKKNMRNKDTTLYLIDDIVSTGATLLEAAKILRKSGFTDIRAVVLASD